MSHYSDVGKFHRKFGLDCAQNGIGPREVPQDLIDFRVKFLKEEIKELEEGYATKDEAKIADALVDLVYVALGTAHLHGFPWEDLWDEVQRANMTKERAVRKEQSLRGSTYDVIKPPGWTAPNIRGILSMNGWSFGQEKATE